MPKGKWQSVGVEKTISIKSETEKKSRKKSLQNEHSH
jgi:hypothetical protein